MPSGCMGTFTLSVRSGRRPLTVLGVHSEEEGRAGEESGEGGEGREGKGREEGAVGWVMEKRAEGRWKREGM